MRNLLLYFLIVLFISCTKEKRGGDNEILLLKLDFNTYTFQGGQKIEVSDDESGLLIDVVYQSPGDAGSVELFYEPTGELLFEGTIVWAGTGKILFPEKFKDASEFKVEIVPTEAASGKIEEIEYGRSHNLPLDENQAWPAVRHLSIVKDYLRDGAEVKYFVYTKSVGVGDPAEWNWFLVFKK